MEDWEGFNVKIYMFEVLTKLEMCESWVRDISGGNRVPTLVVEEYDSRDAEMQRALQKVLRGMRVALG